MKTATQLIAEERQKQIDKYGYTGEHHANHPDLYADRQLIEAATLLTLEDLRQNTWYPKNWDKEWFKRLCARPYNSRLIISGALLAAECDRLEALNSHEVIEETTENAEKSANSEATYIITTEDSEENHFAHADTINSAIDITMSKHSILHMQASKKLDEMQICLNCIADTLNNVIDIDYAQSPSFYAVDDLDFIEIICAIELALNCEIGDISIDEYLQAQSLHEMAQTLLSARI